MKRLLLLVTMVVLVSCSSGGHQHDGKYFTSVDVFGMNFCEVNYLIDGSTITIDNSVTGISKLECKQYDDRIEYIEEPGITKVITILENGNLNVNGTIVLQKVVE